MNSQYYIEGIESNYNPDNDYDVDAKHQVSWVEYNLLQLIKQQQRQIEDLERSLDQVKEDLSFCLRTGVRKI